MRRISCGVRVRLRLTLLRTLACDAILIPCDGVGDHVIVGPLSESAKSRYSFQAPKDFGEDGYGEQRIDSERVMIYELCASLTSYSCRCVVASNNQPGSPTPYLTVVNSQSKIQCT